MELMVILLYMLAYVIPLVISGVIICALVMLVFFIFSRFKPRGSGARKKVINLGFAVSLLAGIAGAVPAYLYVIFLISKVPSHEDEAMAPWRTELLRNGRDNAWSAEVLSGLQAWIDRNGGEFTEAMRLELANETAKHIDANRIEASDSDVAYIEQLANRPPRVDGYSDQTIASAVAYVHITRNGLDEVGHPENFRRAPGHHAFANQMDYTTYLKVAMTRCTQKPELAGCRGVFTESVVNDFETKEDSVHSFNWYEKQELLPNLRAALGYPVKTVAK
jgi:hypothetical protein